MRITEPRTRRGALTALFTLGETYREGAATPAPLEHKLWIGGIDCGGIDNSCTRLSSIARRAGEERIANYLPVLSRTVLT